MADIYAYVYTEIPCKSDIQIWFKMSVNLIQISVVIIFKILTQITLDIIRYLSIFVKSCPLQDFDIIRYLYRPLTGFVGIPNLSHWLSVPYKIVHREIEPHKKEISPPTLVGKYEEVRSLKARFHKSRPLWISRERSDQTYFCWNGSNTQTKIAGFKKMFPRTYRPTPQDCASAASKISADEVLGNIFKNFCIGKYKISHRRSR